MAIQTTYGQAEPAATATAGAAPAAREIAALEIQRKELTAEAAALTAELARLDAERQFLAACAQHIAATAAVDAPVPAATTAERTTPLAGLQAFQGHYATELVRLDGLVAAARERKAKTDKQLSVVIMDLERRQQLASADANAPRQHLAITLSIDADQADVTLFVNYGAARSRTSNRTAGLG